MARKRATGFAIKYDGATPTHVIHWRCTRFLRLDLQNLLRCKKWRHCAMRQRNARQAQTRGWGPGMHYYAYELAHAIVRPLRFGAEALKYSVENPFNPFSATPMNRSIAAACEVFENVTRRYGKPHFGLKETRINGVGVPRERGDRRSQAVLQPHPFQAPFPGRRTGDQRSQGADRCSDVGALRDAAARNGGGHAARTRGLHHRLGGCPRGADLRRALRSQQLHRLPDRVHPHAWVPNACHRGLPAGRSGSCSHRCHGRQRRSDAACVADA